MRTIYDEIADDRIIRRAEVEYENEQAAEYARAYWEGMTPYGDDPVVPLVKLRDRDITTEAEIRRYTNKVFLHAGLVALLLLIAMIAIA